MSQEKRIGKATKTMLGYEDHGILTATIDFDYGGACQGIPGRFFGSSAVEPTGDLGRFVMAVLGAFGVDTWERIPGCTVFCLIEDGLIVGLEPLPTERGKPCDFRDLFDRELASVSKTARREDG